jgi:hypothetical protein
MVARQRVGRLPLRREFGYPSTPMNNAHDQLYARDALGQTNGRSHRGLPGTGDASCLSWSTHPPRQPVHVGVDRDG